MLKVRRTAQRYAHSAAGSALGGAALVLGMDSAAAGHLFPALEIAARAPAGGASWFLTLSMLGAVASAPLVAGAAARVGRLRLLAGALFVFGLASVVVGLSSSFLVTLLARFALGGAGAAVMPLAAAQLSADGKATTRGQRQARLSLWYSAGFLIGMATVSLFLLVTFRLAFFFTGALAWVAAALVGARPHYVSEPESVAVSPYRVAAWVVVLSITAFALNQSAMTSSYRATVGPVYRVVVVVAQAIAAPALLLFVWSDRSSRISVFPRALLHSKVGFATAVLALATGIGQACVVVLPACAMAKLGVSAAATGPLLGPVVVGGLGANLLASSKLDLLGPKPLLSGGLLLSAMGNLTVGLLGSRWVGFEAGAFLIGVGVSLMSSGALRHLATIYGRPSDSNSDLAGVSMLTNVGILLGGTLWGAVARNANTPDLVNAGLFGITSALVPLSLALFFIPQIRVRVVS